MFENIAVVSARVTIAFRRRLDRAGIGLGARDRSSSIRLALEHFVKDFEAGRLRPVDTMSTHHRRANEAEKEHPRTLGNHQ
ncbi:MAG: hypothetical protein ACW99G_04730 [Candidatus Thorarchaeota archaeon]|jgi:hypothetical protein